MGAMSIWHRRLWLTGGCLLLVGLLVWQWPKTESGQSGLIQNLTYYKASIWGSNIGALDDNQLNQQLAQLKLAFENRPITLVNASNRWAFTLAQLGISFDVSNTSQEVWQFNNLSLADRYQLIVGVISPVITPVIAVDSDKCAISLAGLAILPIEPLNASLYYDQGLKIKPDQSGAKFSPISACQQLPKQLASNQSVVDAYVDIISAGITKSDIESKFSQAESMISQPLSLTHDNYRLDLTPQQLFELLEITKTNGVVEVNWSPSKIDELINSIATQVDTYNPRPALGGCQSLVSTGGNWLDKSAAKQYFESLKTGATRSYNLPISYHEPSIKNMTPVADGTSGTVYLTFDDGMTYGDQIMHYASCYGVKVTFFEPGYRAGTDATSLQRAVAAGHAVQSHGYIHAASDYGKHSYDWQYQDIKQSIDAITNITGVKPTYFRPPGGNKNADTYAAASANGVALIMWGVSSADTSGNDSAGVCANVLNGAYDGASVLMHSTKQKTADAVPCIIEGLAARGYNMPALR